MDTKIRVIITGTTGMVGEGVLHECLEHPAVESVLSVSRKPCGKSHPKLREVILPDFSDLSSIEAELSGYEACFFCLGVSSVGMKAEEYFRITYTLTIEFAGVLCRLNPGMTFCYISGAGTYSSERGRMRWARVKGKTENDLMKLSFKAVYAFRPAFMLPTRGLNNTQPMYKYVTWLYPLLQPVFPNYFHTLKDLGLAMINSAINGYDKKILEALDIRRLAWKETRDS